MPLIVGVLNEEVKIEDIEVSGVDLLELRADLFNDFDTVLRYLRYLRGCISLPIIGTIRRKDEGGFIEKESPTEEERLLLFKKLVPFVELVDIELQSLIKGDVIKLAKDYDKKIIISYHNFTETPPVLQLRGIVESAKSLGADIIKITTYAKNKDDLRELALFNHNCPYRPITCFAVGPLGELSRLIGAIFDAHLLYGYIKEPLYEGQTSTKDLRKLINLL